MLNIDFTFLWTAVNLIVLYLVLRKVLFKRVGDFMEQRSADITADIEKGEALKAEGEAFHKEQAAMLESAVDERKLMVQEARQKATKEYDSILADAKKEAARILANAHEEAEREHAMMLAQMKDEVVSLALAAASKIIEANMDTERNRVLVEDFLEKEEVA